MKHVKSLNETYEQQPVKKVDAANARHHASQHVRHLAQ